MNYNIEAVFKSTGSDLHKWHYKSPMVPNLSKLGSPQ